MVDVDIAAVALLLLAAFMMDNPSSSKLYTCGTNIRCCSVKH